MDKRIKETEGMRKERVAMAKTMTTQTIPSKKGYTRKDKHQKDWRD